MSATAAAPRTQPIEQLLVLLETCRALLDECPVGGWRAGALSDLTSARKWVGAGLESERADWARRAG